jgi:opacity protein-like surface antigen
MKKIILAIASLGLFAMGAQAAGMNDTDGVYVGVNQNGMRLTSEKTDAYTVNSSGVYGGYRVGNLAGEISHFERTVEGEKWGVTDFSVIPHLNVAKDLDLLGKLGLRHSSYSSNSVIQPNSSGTALVAGVGLEYSFLSNWTVRALVDYSAKTGDITYKGSHVKATTTTIGVAYKF